MNGRKRRSALQPNEPRQPPAKQLSGTYTYIRSKFGMSSFRRLRLSTPFRRISMVLSVSQYGSYGSIDVSTRTNCSCVNLKEASVVRKVVSPALSPARVLGVREKVRDAESPRGTKPLGSTVDWPWGVGRGAFACSWLCSRVAKVLSPATQHRKSDDSTRYQSTTKALGINSAFRTRVI